MRDRLDADGIIAAGLRVVKKGGVIKFGGDKWKHESLEGLVGTRVYVEFPNVEAYHVDVYERCGEKCQFPEGKICSIKFHEKR